MIVRPVVEHLNLACTWGLPAAIDHFLFDGDVTPFANGVVRKGHVLVVNELYFMPLHENAAFFTIFFRAGNSPTLCLPTPLFRPNGAFRFARPIRIAEGAECSLTFARLEGPAQVGLFGVWARPV